MKKHLLILILFIATAGYSQQTYYVSPNGNDSNSGTFNNPFATVQQAHAVAEAGDTIYLRGGNYIITGSGQRGLLLSKSGTSQNPIRLWAYENETPSLDFTSLSHPYGVHGVTLTGNWWHLKGIEIKNVAEGANNSGAGIIIFGNNNVLELLNVHDIAGKAIQMFGSAANNIVKNCDAHHNYDPINLGGNADGFQCYDLTGVNNKFTGCRAWFNSDDGWDLFDTESAVIIENCWAFLNGYIPDTRTKAGDGNGFKLGRNSTGPRHQAHFNLSAENDLRGFDFNNGSGGMNFYNNTSYDNGLVDFRIGPSLGFNVQNNIGYLSAENIQGGQGNNVSDNSWNLSVVVNNDDFISLDINELLVPRKANGDLPDIDYLHLRPESDLIDKGVDVGFPFDGSSPDLGAFELKNTPPSTPFEEAEDATIFSGNVENNHAGFSGAGFVNLANEVGSYVEWVVDITEAGTKTLNFTFANGTDQNREMQLTVNGEVIQTNLEFEGTRAWDIWSVQSIDALLVQGINTIRLTSVTTNGGPNLDYLELTKALSETPEPVKIYEAEIAAIVNGMAEDNHDGFSGTGFVNLVNEVGSSVEWTVDVTRAEFKTLSFTFANGTDQNREMLVTVNGEVIENDLDFVGTGAWNIWVAQSINTLLLEGSNTIRLTSVTANGGPNLDYLEVAPIKIQEDALFVATYGNDNNAGTRNRPFRTIEKAVQTVEGGGIIFIRKGTYYPEKQLKIERASGTDQERTRVFGFPGEKVIIDGSQFQEIAPNVLNNNIFVHQAAFWHFKGLEIRNALNSAIIVSGNGAIGNILENLNIHDNGNTGIGVYSGASNTLVKNCDSYRNYDSANKGRDADGFAAKFGVGPGTNFVGCRAWANADDGWDFWDAVNGSILNECWAYKNGFDRWNVGSGFQGDGDGFKFGRGTGNHIIKNSVAWENDLRGFNSNSNETEVLVYNCTAWNNNLANFAFSYGTGNFVLKNNLSIDGNIDLSSSVDAEFNSWNLDVTVNENDFLSLSASIAEGFRPASNELPTSDFLNLRSTSDLIDKGTNIANITFNGSAPDLGAFESDFTSSVDSVVEESLNSFDIYPNPISDGRLYIRFLDTSDLGSVDIGISSDLNPVSKLVGQCDSLLMDDVISFTIYDSQGRMTREISKDELKVGSADMFIDVSTIGEGFYILFIDYNQKPTESSRFIIKN